MAEQTTFDREDVLAIVDQYLGGADKLFRETFERVDGLMRPILQAECAHWRQELGHNYTPVIDALVKQAVAVTMLRISTDANVATGAHPMKIIELVVERINHNAEVSE